MRRFAMMRVVSAFMNVPIATSSGAARFDHISQTNTEKGEGAYIVDLESLVEACMAVSRT